MTLTKENHTVIVPLASGSISVDGKWIDLSEVVAEKDGRWLVPLIDLEAIKD